MTPGRNGPTSADPATQLAGKPATPSFVRLLGYVRPYVGILVVAFICAGVYAGTRTARAYLIKPFWDLVVQPQIEVGEQPSWRDWLGAIDLPDSADLGSLAPGGAADSEADPAAAPATAAAPRDSAIADEVREALPNLLLATALLLLLLPAAHFGEEYLTQYLLGRVLVDIQQGLCSKLLSLPLRFHVGSSRGETMSRVMNDAQRAHVALELLFSQMLPSVLMLVAGVATLLFISWQLSLTLLVVGPLIAGIIAFFGTRIRKNAMRRQESQGSVTHRLLQILAGIKVIKAFDAGEAEERAFERENLRFFRNGMKVAKYRAFSRTVVEAVNNSLGVGFLLVGFGAVMSGVFDLTFGDVFSFILVMQSSCYGPMKAITRGWTKLQESTPSAERFFELLDTEADVADPPGAVDFDGLEHGIRIDKVSFSYGREPVLRDVSLDVAAGEVVAIVGRTGSGKTTLADLLLRFYEPDSGAILVDGIDLRQVKRHDWLEQLAVVTQEPFLFSGSIRDNIRYGRPEATDAEIAAATRAAHVDEFAAKLAEGLDTDVGEAGTQLSGGQRQRITIARAILRDPRVLIFDEATSSLDAQSERYVQEAIEALLGGRTVFIIAHRLATVRHADKILVLDDGVVAACGNHETLMAQGGLYASWTAMQGEAPA